MSEAWNRTEQLADDIQAYFTMDGVYLDIQQCLGVAGALLADEDWSIRPSDQPEYPQKPGAWEWHPEYITRWEQGMAAAEDYVTGIEPSRRAETIDDFMTGWRIASETPRPVGEEKP